MQVADDGVGPSGTPTSIPDGPPGSINWRAIFSEGIRAVRTVGSLAGEVTAEKPSPTTDPIGGKRMVLLVLLIAMVAWPFSCGMSLLGWSIHENLGAAAAATEKRRAKERDSEQDARLDMLELHLWKMQFTMDSIADKVGAKVPKKDED